MPPLLSGTQDDLNFQFMIKVKEFITNWVVLTRLIIYILVFSYWIVKIRLYKLLKNQ